jgi:outer membrane protein assembly factor BamB
LSASPVLGDGKIYVATADGEIHVLSVGADWEVLATNDLAEPMYATPALAPGRIFVRTDGHLYAFGDDEGR